MPSSFMREFLPVYESKMEEGCCFVELEVLEKQDFRKLLNT
jgi:hypothetical protein